MNNIIEIEVNPQVAERLLSANKGNRPIKDKLVSRYANQMVERKWFENTGELFLFTSPSLKRLEEGILINGQHRLLAVIRSGVTLKFEAKFNVDERVFNVIDSGISRTSKDLFHIKNISYASIIPSILNAVYDIKGISEKRQFSQRTLTAAELMVVYNEKPEYWEDIARKAYTWYSRVNKIVSPTFIASMYAFLIEVDRDDAELFFEIFSDPMNMESKPISLLRNKLLQNRMSKIKMSDKTKRILTIKAWNYYRKGDNNVVYLKFNFKNEEFPKAI